ncbi:MAG: hypothetical protein R3E84_05345 [Pseudomonadales bacterium]
MNRTLILLSVTIGCALSHAEATLLHPTEAYCAAYEVLGVTKGGFSMCQRAYGHEWFEKWNARPGFGPFRKGDTRYVIHKRAYIFPYDGKRTTKVKNPVFDTLVSSMADASPETVQAVFMQAMQYESTGEVKTVNGIDCTVSRSVTMGRVCLASEGILAEQEVVGKVQRITSLEPGVSVDEATYDPEVWPRTITEAPDIGNALKALRGLKSPKSNVD